MSNNDQAPLSFFNDRAAALRFYHEHGYFIEHHVFNDAECQAFIDAGENLQDAKNGIYKPAMMPHRENEFFLTCMKNKKIATIMAELIGGKPVGLQSEFFYCRPGTRGFSLHQDNFYVEAADGVFASAWTALTDTAKPNGGLIVYPGTHKEGQLPTRKLNLGIDAGQDPNANNEETVVPPQYQPMDAVVPKGAVLFIHGHIVHGSNPNTSNASRYVLLNTYIKQGEDFRAGRYAKRAEVCLD